VLEVIPLWLTVILVFWLTGILVAWGAYMAVEKGLIK
jgi:hypothetical protein